MLLSLKSNLQISKYIYKMMMVYKQAISITWSKLLSDGTGLSYFIADIRLILKDN